MITLEVNARRPLCRSGMRVLEDSNLLRRHTNLQVSFPRFPEDDRNCAYEANAREPVDSPDQREPQYHSKEGEEDPDG